MQETHFVIGEGFEPFSSEELIDLDRMGPWPMMTSEMAFRRLLATVRVRTSQVPPVTASGLTVEVDESECIVIRWEGVQGGWSHTVTDVNALVDALRQAKESRDARAYTDDDYAAEHLRSCENCGAGIELGQRLCEKCR